MYWWEINGQGGHEGAGRGRDLVIYIFGKDIQEVMSKYRKVPAIKYGKHSQFPTISQISEEEAKKLEEEIISEQYRGITIGKVRRTFYHPKEHYLGQRHGKEKKPNWKSKKCLRDKIYIADIETYFKEQADGN